MSSVEATSGNVNVQKAKDLTASRLVRLEEAVVQHQGALERISETMKDVSKWIKVLDNGVNDLGKAAVAGSATLREASTRIKVPQPPKFNGSRDAKEIDNFLWCVERYFDALQVRDDVTKITTARDQRRSKEADSSNEIGGGDRLNIIIRGDGTRAKEATRDQSRTQWRDKGKTFYCFLCGGPHMVRECPQRAKISAMVMRYEDEESSEAHEPRRLGAMRLLKAGVVDKPTGLATATSRRDWLPRQNLIEKERQQCRVSDVCGCLWSYLTELRRCDDRSHVHYNVFYDPRKHEGALLPPAAALAPTLWPQFLLRWACPKEVEAGDLEANCRGMFGKFSEFQKAKEAAERKTREVSAAVESLTLELRKEKQLSSSAVNQEKRASRENAAIKRAIQSLGCKIHFSSNGDTSIDIQNYKAGSQISVAVEPERSLQDYEKSDLSVSIAVIGEDEVPTDPLNRICESFCPLRSADGYCRWPEAGCAQISSQFVGVKANFDAFDRLSIDDGYF
ncbi:hypothetical protein KSS87_011915 [Heliosperma pusillum]|nr:hypothetical protein KSS87_011915 [Heliosperma pusillum]